MAWYDTVATDDLITAASWNDMAEWAGVSSWTSGGHDHDGTNSVGVLTPTSLTVSGATTLSGAMTFGDGDDNLSANVGTGACLFTVAETDGLRIQSTTNGASDIVSLIRGDGGGDASGSSYFYRNLASGSTAGPVVSIVNDNSGDDRAAIQVKQDGTSYGMYINHTNATGIGFYCRKDVASASNPPANFHQDSTTGGQPCITLDQDDTSEGFIDFIGSDTGAISTSDTNSDASVTVELNGTAYTIPLYAV